MAHVCLAFDSPGELWRKVIAALSPPVISGDGSLNACGSFLRAEFPPGGKIFSRPVATIGYFYFGKLIKKGYLCGAVRPNGNE